MSKTYKLIFSRYGFSVFFILIEIGGIIALFSFLAHYAPILYGLLRFSQVLLHTYP